MLRSVHPRHKRGRYTQEVAIPTARIRALGAGTTDREHARESRARRLTYPSQRCGQTTVLDPEGRFVPEQHPVLDCSHDRRERYSEDR